MANNSGTFSKDFTLIPNTPAERRAAAITIAANATDHQDLQRLLEALGLTQEKTTNA